MSRPATSRRWSCRFALIAGLATAACATPANKTADAAVAQDTEPAVDSAADVPVAPIVPVLLPVAATGNFAVAAAGWHRGDLHFHTNHSDDAKSQGGDDVPTALAVADAFRHATFLARFPELAGNGLDFVAVTDHRTDAVLQDPTFQHDHLILIAGEEYGGAGHAGIWGFQKHVSNDPQQGESANQRHQDAIAEAHAQGALFSVNHPTQDNAWVWDVQGYDGIELWNGPWSAFYGPVTVEEIDARAKAIGVENPFVRQAAEVAQGGGSNAQAMRFWQYHLSAGRHVAPVGGGDRHMLLPAGLPTTYVHPPEQGEFAGRSGKALGPKGILAGIAARRTFVSRSPFGAQIDLQAEAEDGTKSPMGAELKAPGSYRIHARVGRAKGGLLRLYAGSLGKGADGRWPEPQVVWETPVPADRAEGTWTWQVPATGGWLHAVVLEQLQPEPLPQSMAGAQAILAKLPTGKALGDMLKVFVQLVDVGVAFDPATCDPGQWQADQGQCMPMDQDTLATFYMPDSMVRLLNTWFEGGQATPWCMGAVSSAFLARPAAGK